MAIKKLFFLIFIFRKEISALQAENYSLERQLFSYQKSIAFAHSRGTYSDDLASLEGRGIEDDEDAYYEERTSYSLGDRSLSTETEYAWDIRYLSLSGVNKTKRYIKKGVQKNV